MEYRSFSELVAFQEQPEHAVDYLTEKMRRFLPAQEYILICYPNRSLLSPGSLLEKAARHVGAIPVIWDEDRRWKTLLRQAFTTHAVAIAGPPRIILGLSKMARATNTPLNIHDALLCESYDAVWMDESIKRWLDCRIWHCFAADPTMDSDSETRRLEERLLTWTSILDFSMKRSEYGTELKVITFPGEKRPKLPSCARLVLRNWEPEQDVPF